MIDPNNSSIYLSGGWIYNGSTYVMAVSRSTNSGATWERDTLTTVQSCCYALAVDPTSKSNTIYAGGSTGVYKSMNAGLSWIPSSTGLSGTVYDLAVNSRSPNVLYTGTSSGVYKSTDAGANWSLTGLTGVNDIILLPGGQDTLFAGTTTGVSQSVNGGATWTAMNTGLADTYVNALGYNPAARFLFAGTRSRGMYYWNLTVGTEETPVQETPSRLSIQPCPAIGSTRIEFNLPSSGTVTLTVYDALGRSVKRLVDNQSMNAGNHFIAWDCCDGRGDRVPEGVYFVKFGTSEIEVIKKLPVVR
jgi:photosystem II stability/assembly factor-like uncharacterized protein